MASSQIPDEENVSQDLLFGGYLGWNSEDWTDSDDRVRGGSSQSYLHVHNNPNHNHAVFTGNLDTKTLGGAGFASQRTAWDDKHWDLSSSRGIALSYCPASTDGKVYTFILKDTLLPRDPDTGREQSTISWEYDFRANDTATKQEDRSEESDLKSICIPWREFKPTYRGRDVKSPEALKVHNIRRMSIMNRSFFETQSGPFKLDLVSIATMPSSSATTATLDNSSTVDADCGSTISTLKEEEENNNNKSLGKQTSSDRQGFWSKLGCL